MIKTHNETFIQLFNKPLKPKFHFLTHYVHIVKQSGPLKYLWTFRYESKHKEAKGYARSITSRKNISYSLSMKAALKFTAFLKEHCKGLPNPIEYGSTQSFSIENCPYFKLIINFEILKSQISTIVVVMSLTYKGCTYKKGYFLTKTDKEVIKLYEILNILINKSNEVFFIVNEYKLIEFSEHFQSYVVGPKHKFFEIINITSFTGPPIHLYCIPDGTTLIRNKIF